MASASRKSMGPMLGQAIVHIGLGNFSKAHLAYFTHNYNEKLGPSEWGICAVDRDNPRTRETQEFLKKSDFTYDLITKSSDSKNELHISSIRNLVNMGEDPVAAVKQLCLPTTRICSLTITEKGYCCDVNTGDLMVDNPEIKHDLENISEPKSAIGLICSALKTRRDTGMPPITIMSCDNLPGNGHVTENAVTQFAELLDPSLREWIGENVTFPNSMVDRITPQTATAEAPIISEEFAQWVVEDKFCNGRPYWEVVDGILVVDDVMPYEKMKVRMLNGAHSALSYLSYLCGYRDVDHALAAPDVHDFVKLYLAEVAQTVPKVPGVDLPWYQGVLMERFSNPNIKDQVQRLAEDGSTKLQTTMIPVIREKTKTGKASHMLALAVAAVLLTVPTGATYCAFVGVYTSPAHHYFRLISQTWFFPSMIGYCKDGFDTWLEWMILVLLLKSKTPLSLFMLELNSSSPCGETLQPLAQQALSQRDVLPFMEAAFGAKEVKKMRSFPGKVQAWYSRLLSEGPWRVLDSLDEFAFGFADFGEAIIVVNRGRSGEADDFQSNPFAERTITELVKLTYQDLHSMFETYDVDKNGYLDIDEITNLLEDFVGRLNEELPKANVREVFGIREDSETNAEVLLKYALESLPNPEDEKTVALLVSRLDHDGDGKISAEEFVSGFGDVVRIRYNQIRADISEPRKSEVTSVAVLPPRTFDNWTNVEKWGREIHVPASKE
eukprot:jgi/Bigna1/86197/estExt_fgenesh1_pg.C_80296